MPVKSLNSSVLKWPSQKTVDRSVRSWTAEQVKERSEIIRLGYFGSYARGDWGVGSDLDLIAVVNETSEPFERRSLSWDLNSLPVPAEIIVYSLTEWENLEKKDTKFARMLKSEAIWTFRKPSIG
jgi:predicted nucleotidyltransferase